MDKTIFKESEYKNSKQKLYQCSWCHLHYKDESCALKCYAWCSKNKSCNVEITKHSEERA